jgi:hypothetical protein
LPAREPSDWIEEWSSDLVYENQAPTQSARASSAMISGISSGRIDSRGLDDQQAIAIQRDTVLVELCLPTL